MARQGGKDVSSQNSLNVVLGALRAARKGKLGGLVAIAIVGAWLLFEAAVLNGTTVVNEHYMLNSPLTFMVDEAQAEYKVSIGGRKGQTGGNKRKLVYTITDPDGEQVVNGSDSWQRHMRRVTFRPDVIGECRIVVRDAMDSGDYRNPNTWVKVEKNDRAILLSQFGM